MALTIDIIHQIAILENGLRDKINSFPDNLKINRISHNCFIVNSSDLGKSWAPEYHDFKCQYKEIINIIGKTRLENIDKALEAIIKTGRSKAKDHTFVFNPVVLKHLEKIL